MKLSTCTLALALLLSITLAGHGSGLQPLPAAPPVAKANPPLTKAVVDASAPAVEGLMELLIKPCWDMRRWAADALGRFGPKASKADKSLVPLLEDPVPAVQQSVANALGQIGLPAGGDAESVETKAQVIAALVRKLGWDQVPAVRSAAATALIQIGPAADAAVPGVTELLGEQCCWDVRRHAADVLGGIGRKDQKAASKLTDLMSLDPEPLVRIAAAAALPTVDPDPKAAVKSLVKLLSDWHPGVRAAGAELLGGIHPVAKESISALIGALDDPEPRVRIAAVEALGQMGPAAESVLPEIAKRLDDCIADVRQAVLEAMSRIKGG
jgi:HEAT repeat protein